jgi:hypothetical protein
MPINTNQIVSVLVSQQIAPAPSQLQQTGAFISQGGTTTSAGTLTLLTESSSLADILSPISNTLVSAVWTDATHATVTTTSDTGMLAGDVVQVVLTGCVPTGWNGTFIATYISATSFNIEIASNPGAISTLGSFILGSTNDLVNMNNTFFAQGESLSVYVLELGIGSTANGVIALNAYIANPTISIYAFLLPTAWDVESTAWAMANMYTSETSLIYFYVSTTLSTYTNWETFKSVLATVQSPLAPSTEFTAASIFWTALSYNPGPTNLMSPLSFTFVNSVTPYVLSGSQQTALKTAGVNWITTGAEGGISNSIIYWGTFMDVNPFTYWYAIDWLQINVHIALANAIINGSNTPTNPLQYNQAGVNALQTTAQATVNNGIGFGVILSPCIVNAISFIDYVTANPSAYASGSYGGLSCTFVPARGFEQVTIYLTASQFVV